ncbi:hypothetical protein [Nocardia sp. CA-119907]|uniref:hypothetical protein n=1 Tax=Nocardia sp. CA-119907 TaxID=3239973 RepID=UPI003D99760F
MAANGFWWSGSTSIMEVTAVALIIIWRKLLWQKPIDIHLVDVPCHGRRRMPGDLGWLQRIRLMAWNTIGRQFAQWTPFWSSGEREDRQQPGRVWLVLLLMCLALVWAAQTAAKAWLPMLLRDHPLVLISLDSRTRDLVLASSKLGIGEFITVAVAWRFGVHFLYYLSGRWYGDAAVGWIRARSRVGGKVADRLERTFRRWSIPAVFLVSNKLVCVLAGSARMRSVAFVPIHLSGTAIRIVALCVILRSNNSRLLPLVTAMDRNANWLTVLFVIGTVVAVPVSAYMHYRVAVRSSERDSAWPPS